MSDAFIKWCREKSTSGQFLDRIEKFGAVGVSLIHPVRKTAVLLDVDGNDVAVSAADIAELVDRRVGRAISLEWWFTADDDLTCTYLFVPGGREVQTYYLDGLSTNEVTLVCQLIRDLFWEDREISEWLVLDITGRSADFDWDEYLLYGVGTPPISPDLLVMRTSSNLRSAAPSFRSMRHTLHDGFVEFERRG